MDGSNASSLLLTPSPTNIECADQITYDIEPTVKIEIAMYVAFFLVGGPLNIASILRLRRKFWSHGGKGARRRSSSSSGGRPNQMQLMRLNLNVADLLTLFVYVPTQVIWLLTYEWYGGELLCRICKFFSTFSFYLNSFVVACIALDRLSGAFNISVLNGGAAYRATRKRLMVAWVMATALSAPQLFIFRIANPFEPCQFSQCTPIWTVVAFETQRIAENSNATEIEVTEATVRRNWFLDMEHIYSVTHLLFVFWIPTIIIATSYLVVICVLRRMSKTPSTSGEEMKKKARAVPTTTTSADSPVYTSIFDGVPAEEDEELTNGSTPPQADDEAANNNASQRDKQQSWTNGRRCENTSLTVAGNNANANARHSGGAALSPFVLKTINRARRKARRQAALILLAYLSFWSPYNVLAIRNVLGLWEESGTGATLIASILPFLNTLIVANPIINPIIYGLQK